MSRHLAAQYSADYEKMQELGNSHAQCVAYAEWQLFSALSAYAPAGSVHAMQQAATWLREVARLGVKIG